MRLLGFDAREMFLDPSVAWTDARRQAYLLTRDARKPYSVDVLVWPTVFGDGIGDDLESEAASRLVSTSIWRGPNSPLWEDLTLLRAALGKASPRDYVLLAVSEAVPEASTTSTTPTSGLEPARNPAGTDPSWPLLGYDVADRGLFSGLTDCAYTASEWSRLAPVWAARLSEHHLFVDVGDAEQYCAESSRRVPEHAPFFVFELRTIPT